MSDVRFSVECSYQIEFIIGSLVAIMLKRPLRGGNLEQDPSGRLCYVRKYHKRWDFLPLVSFKVTELYFVARLADRCTPQMCVL